MPGMFALADRVIGNPVIATFAAFGSFAMVLLVDFQGPMRARLQAQAALAVVCAGLVCLGTLASNSDAVAALAMAVVGFAVIFAGVVSSVLASATTSMLLAFILPVSLAAPASSIPDRLAGWGLASGASLLAIRLLWPSPVREPLRGGAVEACLAAAARLRADVARALGSETDPAAHDRASARWEAAMAALHDEFFATPNRPTGLSTTARAIVRLVDELRWLHALTAAPVQPSPAPPVDPLVCAVKAAAATVLERGADLLAMPGSPREGLDAAQSALRRSLVELETDATRRVPNREPGMPAPASSEHVERFVAALEPGFRAQELTFVVSQIASNIDLAAAAEQRTWLQRTLGRPPRGLVGPLTATRQRAGAHVERHSVWLHNAVRGAIALALAVLVAKVTGVAHAFWVVFGTLSVLRTSALITGQNALRALAGTLAGFIVGAALITVTGTDTTVLWVLLPAAVLLAGLAPATVSFAAGQAAFTLTLLILFNILEPAGWRIGLVRIEDVALGSAVSLGVGILFWPRGAAGALGIALAEAYGSAVRYLDAAVAFGMGRCDACVPSRPAPEGEAARAAASARRLDDAFRGYLAERGSGPVPLAAVTSLVNGAAGLRLAADAVLDLWQPEDRMDGDRTGARRELEADSVLVTRWYDSFAGALTGDGVLPAPPQPDAGGDARLVAAVSADLRGLGGSATATAVRMIWTRDHLDAARRLAAALVEPARTAAGSLTSAPLRRRWHWPAPRLPSLNSD